MEQIEQATAAPGERRNVRLACPRCGRSDWTEVTRFGDRALRYTCCGCGLLRPLVAR